MRTLSIPKRIERLFRKGLTHLIIAFGCLCMLKPGSVQATSPVYSPSIPHATAQQPISGRVSDENGQPLGGVSVWLKGTQQRVSTDANGAFNISGIGSNDVLVFSYMGYENLEEAVGQRRQVTVSLLPTASALDEVVVVGYGAQTKRKVSTAITKVPGTAINQLPVMNPGDALVGLGSGMQVQGGAGSTPGSDPIIRIRGVSSLGASGGPLFVVDGYPLPNSSEFSRINVSDIESIEVLKDAASASIYGSRAANGVVLVKTKQGTEGRMDFSFNSYTGIQQAANTIDVMNKAEYLDYMRAARKAANLPYPDVYDSPDELPDTDWQNTILRTAPMSKIELAARGGNDKVQFSLSGGYSTQTGTMIGTDYKLITLRANVDANLTKSLKVGVKFAPSYSDLNVMPTPRSPGLWGYSPIYAAMLMPPVVSARLDNGDYGQNNVAPHTQYGFSEVNIYNPLSILELYKNRNSRFGAQNNLYIEWESDLGLKVNSQFGALFATAANEEYIPSTLGSSRAAFANTNNPLLNAIGSSVSNGREVDWIWENSVTYNKQIKEHHNLSALALFSMQKYSAFSTISSGRVGSFTNDLIQNPSASNDQVGSVNYSGLNSFVSYVGRLNYDYKDKYLLSASVRSDGSSKFGSNERYGVFKSFSAGWRITEEAFMQSQRIIDELKIRASYGETGNANIGDFTWISGVSPLNYSFDNQRVAGASQNGFMNRNLTWEKSNQVNVGLEAGFFNSRIYATIDIYEKMTDGMLFNKDLPGIVGYATSFQTNIGKLRNRGLEIDVTSTNIQRALTWNTNFNISFNKTKVLDLGGRDALNFMPGTPGKNNVYRIEVGQPLGNMFGVIIDGVIKNNEQLTSQPQWPGSVVGDFQVRDANGDGLVNDGDRTLLGNGLPEFVYGLGNDFRYKNFDLNILLQGAYGNTVINAASHHTSLWAGRFNAVRDIVNNYFDPENPERDVKYARIGSRSGFNGLPEISNHSIGDGSFLRLRNLSLGYTLPFRWRSEGPPATTRIYFMAQNLFTLTKYQGMNPEGSQYGSSAYQPGSDQVGYPVNRTFIFGLDVKF